MWVIDITAQTGNTDTHSLMTHTDSDQMAFSLEGTHYKWQLVTHTHTHTITQHIFFCATLKHTHTQTLGTDSIEGPEMRHDGTWQSNTECFFFFFSSFFPPIFNFWEARCWVQSSVSSWGTRDNWSIYGPQYTDFRNAYITPKTF